MEVLPRRIPVLDQRLNVVRTYERLESPTVGGRRLQEADYDGLLVRHLDALADVLREAEVIDEDSTLRFLGR